MDIPFFSSSNNGNTLIQYFNPPIVLDQRKKYAMCITNSTMFFTFPNIYNTTSSTYTKNNVLNFTVGATAYTITIPQGLYDINSLSNTISNSLVNLGLANNLIILTGDAPTQRSVIQLNSANASIQFGTSSIRTVLGFDAVTIGPGVSGTFYYSNNIAAFNTLSEILLHATCCNGFKNNNVEISSNSDVVASIVINSGISQQIQYDPNQLIKVPIVQYMLDRVTFYFTDQENRPLINNEPWTITGIITEIK